MNVTTSQSQGIHRIGRLQAQPSNVASTVGRVLGTHGRDTLKPSLLAKDIAIGGLGDIPFEGLFASQAYRRGELKANEFVARVVSGSIGGGIWTLGGALAGIALAPLGLPAVAVGILGFAAGMTGQELFDRLLGNKLAEKLAASLPEKSVKGLADGFTKYIANPLNDYVWRPVVDTVKGHKLLAAGVAGALALKFPGAAKAIGREALTMGGGMAAGLGISMGVLTPLMGEHRLPFEKEAAAESEGLDPKWVAAFQTTLGKVEAKGATRAQALQFTSQHFLKTMVENGAPEAEAKELVAAIAQAATAKPQAKANGKQLPAGMLMAR